MGDEQKILHPWNSVEQYDVNCSDTINIPILLRTRVQFVGSGCLACLRCDDKQGIQLTERLKVDAVNYVTKTQSLTHEYCSGTTFEL